MAKTYYPGAVLNAARAHRYLSRYQAKLAPTVTTIQAAELVNVIAALASFLAKWPTLPKEP